MQKKDWKVENHNTCICVPAAPPPAQYLVFKRGGEGGYRLPATNHKLTLLFAFNPKYFSDLTQNISQTNMKYFSDRTKIFIRLNQNISEIGPKYFSDWNNKFKSKGDLTGNQPQTDPDTFTHIQHLNKYLWYLDKYIKVLGKYIQNVNTYIWYLDKYMGSIGVLCREIYVKFKRINEINARRVHRKRAGDGLVHLSVLMF